MGLIFVGSTARPRSSIMSGPADELEKRRKAIASTALRIDAAGQDIPEPRQPGNLLFSALDILDRPRNAVVNAILRGGSEGMGAAAWRGLTGQQRASSADLLEQAGMAPGWGRAALGFVGDMALDPLNLVGGVAAKGLTSSRAGCGHSCYSPPVQSDLPALA